MRHRHLAFPVSDRRGVHKLRRFFKLSKSLQRSQRGVAFSGNVELINFDEVLCS
jgi:hypothetical protein